MGIFITSKKKEGFWRCGVKHSAQGKFFADGFFTKEQVARLKAEPALIVEEMEKAPAAAAEKEESTGKKEKR